MPEPTTYPGVYIEEVGGARPIEGVETSTAAFLGAMERGPLTPTLVTSVKQFESEFGELRPTLTLGYAVRHFFENGGKRAVIGRLATRISASDRAAKSGLFALDAVDFNLLCIPPYAPGNDLSIADWEAASRYCAERRAMLLIDAPAAWTAANAQRSLADLHGIAHDNAALYFSRVVARDPLDGKPRTFAPCGMVAGVIARVDEQRGIWKAPAGVEATLNGVLDLTERLSDAVQGLLNPLGINGLRKFTGPPVVWGARTLSTSPEWKYIPVRRLALYIEESVERGTQWAVFEPNGEAVWSQIRLHVGAFLNGLFRQGAFQGRTPRDAYFVKCDVETTTQDDINNGRLNVIVGFAPLKPAEFIVLTVRQLMQPDP